MARPKRTLSVMATTEPASAIVVRIRIPTALERLRARWDRAASDGVPAHVTILFPFLPSRRLSPAVRRELAVIAAATEPFGVRFARIERFPGVVYAAPEPSGPFVRLTDAFAARFPEHRPYGGAFDTVVPHLTIAEAPDAPLDDIVNEASAILPFEGRVRGLEVLVQDGEGQWRGRWRLALGRPID